MISEEIKEIYRWLLSEGCQYHRCGVIFTYCKGEIFRVKLLDDNDNVRDRRSRNELKTRKMMISKELKRIYTWTLIDNWSIAGYREFNWTDNSVKLSENLWVGWNWNADHR